MTTAAFIGSMVGEISSGLESIVGMMPTSAITNEIQTSLAAVQTGAPAFTTADNPNQSDVQRIITDATAVLNAAAALPLPGDASLILRGLDMMLPLVSGLASIFLPASPPAAASSTTPAAPAA